MIDVTKLPAWERLEKAIKAVDQGVAEGWGRFLMEATVDELVLAKEAVKRDAALPGEYERMVGRSHRRGQQLDAVVTHGPFAEMYAKLLDTVPPEVRQAILRGEW